MQAIRLAQFTSFSVAGVSVSGLVPANLEPSIKEAAQGLLSIAPEHMNRMFGVVMGWEGVGFLWGLRIKLNRAA